MSMLQSIFLREKSLENYSDGAVLELLFSTAGVRGDTQSIIQSLFDTFGSFRGILEARPAQLMKLPGVTRKVATLVSMVAPLAKVWERANMEDPKRIGNSREAEAFAKSLLMGERTERFFVIALNARCKVLGYQKISEGSLSEVSAYPRMVMETALNFNAHSVLLCHNHPGGTCAPSHEDIASTLQLQKLLNGVGIMVLDHIIVAGDRTYSMIQHGDVDYRCR